MQDGRAVRVGHGLGVAGGAGGVAHARRVGFLHLGVAGLRLVLHDPGVIVLDPFDRLRQRSQHHDLLDAGAARLDGRNHAREQVLDQEHSVLGVVDDPADLIGVQPDVDGVQHAAHARHAQVGFEVAVGIDGQRGDPLTRLHARRRQRTGQPQGAPGHLAVGGAVRLGHRLALLILARHHQADDLALGEEQAGALDDLGNQQRNIHHGAFHVGSPGKRRSRRGTQRRLERLGIVRARSLAESGAEFGAGPECGPGGVGVVSAPA